jgi:hypothetical protein
MLALEKDRETWYGVFEMQTSKYGNVSSLHTSPSNISNLFCSGLARKQLSWIASGLYFP